jgi:septal ring factor EnvC (AmiA/AmiB activator)
MKITLPLLLGIGGVKKGGGMKTKMALIVSGAVTAFVIMLVIGLLGGANWFTQTIFAAGTSDPATVTGSTSTDVATLQRQAATYQQELQQANTQLQAANNEIATLQAELRASGSGLNNRRFRGDDQNGQQGGFFNPFGQ